MLSNEGAKAGVEARPLALWEYAVLCLGFGFFFAVCPFSALGTTAMRQDAMGWQEILFARTVFLVATAVCFSVWGSLRRARGVELTTRTQLVEALAGGLATVAGTAILFVGPGPLPLWLVGLASGVTMGVSFVLLGGAWVRVFFAVRRTKGRMMCMVAFACSFMTTVVITWLSNIAAPAGLWLLAVIALCAGVSCVLFAVLARGSDPAWWGGASERAVEFDLTTYTRAILLAFGMSWALAYNMSVDVGYGSTGPDEYARWLATILSCGALLVLVVVFVRKVDIGEQRFGLMLRWVITAVGILWAFTPVITAASPVVAGVAFIMVFWIQLVVVFIFVMEVCLESRLPFATVLASYFGTFVLGACVGSLVFWLVRIAVPELWMAYSLIAALGAAASLLVMPFMPSRASSANVFTLERFPEDEDAAVRNERARREFVEGSGFTPREAEVFDLLVLGRTRDEIAAELDISPWTVKNHIKAVFSKTGTHSAKELMALVYGERG